MAGSVPVGGKMVSVPLSLPVPGPSPAATSVTPPQSAAGYRIRVLDRLEDRHEPGRVVVIAVS